MEESIRQIARALTAFNPGRMEEVGVLAHLFVLSVSLVCAVFIAHLYKHFYSARSSGSQIHRAFPLLGISVTAIFVTVQFSLPLSLGLLGALSIVRFRTPIKEPEEIGFLMLVIATSLCCATFNFVFVGIILAAGVAGLFLMNSKLLSRPQDEGVILITLPADHDGFDNVVGFLEKSCVNTKVESISKGSGETVISCSFNGLKKQTLSGLKESLDEFIGATKYDLFLNQQRIV